MQIVKRKLFRLVISVVRGRGADGVADPRVEVAPGPVGQTLVSGVADERVFEAHLVPVDHQHVREAPPHVVFPSGYCIQHMREEVEREGAPEDCRSANQVSLFTREAVEACGDEALDRVGETLGVARG